MVYERFISVAVPHKLMPNDGNFVEPPLVKAGGSLCPRKIITIISRDVNASAVKLPNEPKIQRSATRI